MGGIAGAPDPRHLPFPLRTLAVGLRPVAASAWLEPATADEVAAHAADLDGHEGTVAWLPGSEPAQAELAALVGAAGPTIADAGRAVADDLCLLDGPDLVLVAGALAHPNRWRLADKLGRPPVAVHGPVPGYEARLGAPVERVLRALSADRAVERWGWAVLDDPALHQPEATSGMPTAFDAGALWLRVERQALRRLPATGAVAFAIRTRVWPLGVLAQHPEQARGLAEAVRTSPPGLLAYKGLTLVADDLAAWLEAAAGR